MHFLSKHLKDVDDSVDHWIISWNHIQVMVQKHPIQDEMENMERLKKEGSQQVHVFIGNSETAELCSNRFTGKQLFGKDAKDVGSAAKWTMRTHECSKHFRMTCCD